MVLRRWAGSGAIISFWTMAWKKAGWGGRINKTCTGLWILTPLFWEKAKLSIYSIFFFGLFIPLSSFWQWTCIAFVARKKYYFKNGTGGCCETFIITLLRMWFGVLVQFYFAKIVDKGSWIPRSLSLHAAERAGRLTGRLAPTVASTACTSPQAQCGVASSPQRKVPSTLSFSAQWQGASKHTGPAWMGGRLGKSRLLSAKRKQPKGVPVLSGGHPAP